jgi:hypothetical protein
VRADTKTYGTQAWLLWVFYIDGMNLTWRLDAKCMQCPGRVGRYRDARSQMLDALMVILGTGLFALLLGYVAVCDRL